METSCLHLLRLIGKLTILKIVENNKIILLFDGVCNLCNGFVQFILKRNSKKNIYFGALQSETGQRLLKEKHLPSEEFDSLIVITNSTYLKRSQAFFLLCKNLDFPWPILAIFRFIPSFISDFIYDRVAKNRYMIFGRREVCMLPTKDVLDRFI